MISWLLLAQWVARAVLLTLGGISIWSVGIMIDRYRLFKSMYANDSLERAKELVTQPDPTLLAQWIESGKGLLPGTLRAALVAEPGNSEKMDRAARSYLLEEKAKLEKGLTFLATVGSNAPFIGLFGTVMGIIEAFGELAKSQQGTQAVMSGIAEALVATAVGLFVAIPAVVAYNSLNGKVRTLLTECEIIRDLYMSRPGRG